MKQQLANIIIDKKNNDVYLETFLIDANHLNNKGWKVSFDDPTDFDRQVQASLGHPLVLYEKILSNGEKIWDHPVSETGSVSDDIQFQKPYIVGKSVHNKKVRDGLWNTTYKIIHEGAKKFLSNVKSLAIPLYSSVHLVRSSLEDRANIRKWAIIHNAIVSDPANGKDKAIVASICEGDPGGACSSLFASMTTPSDSKGCGYCLGDSLKNYVTSHSSKIESASNMSTVTTQSTAATGAEGSNNNPTGNPAVSTGGQNQQQLADPSLLNKNQEGNKQSNNSDSNSNDASQKTIEELQNKIKTLEAEKTQSQNQESEDQVTKLNNRIKDLESKYELRDRSANIEKLLTQAIVMYTEDNGSIKEKEYNTDLEKLVKSNHNLDEIQELIQARYVLHLNAKGRLTSNKASNTSPDSDNNSSQVSETASSKYTEMDTSNSSNSKGTPYFVNVLASLQDERIRARNNSSNNGGVY